MYSTLAEKKFAVIDPVDMTVVMRQKNHIVHFDGDTLYSLPPDALTPFVYHNATYVNDDGAEKIKFNHPREFFERAEITLDADGARRVSWIDFNSERHRRLNIIDQYKSTFESIEDTHCQRQERMFERCIESVSSRPQFSRSRAMTLAEALDDSAYQRRGFTATDTNNRELVPLEFGRRENSIICLELQNGIPARMVERHMDETVRIGWRGSPHHGLRVELAGGDWLHNPELEITYYAPRNENKHISAWQWENAARVILMNRKSTVTFYGIQGLSAANAESVAQVHEHARRVLRHWDERG